MSKHDAAETLVLEYNLFDLPTAQHKAGLAGLLLMVESMKRRRMKNLPDVAASDRAAVTVAFTRESMQSVFDDLYDAVLVEVEAKQKWSEVEPKRIVEKSVTSPNGKAKTEKRFVYDVIQPKGAFLAALYPDDSWVALWRDMLWKTLRSKPASRGLFKERADGKPSSVAGDAKGGLWAELIKAQADLAKGKLRTDSVAGTLFIGAQDTNAERVSFQGPIAHNFLLHFWLIASLTYVPRTLAIDGKSDYAGFVIVVPEPSHLAQFTSDFLAFVASLPTEAAGRTPRAALIDVPEEGGLEYLYHMVRRRVADSELSLAVSAVEIYRLESRGKSVHTLAAERISPTATMLRRYEALRKGCWNPLYKSLRIGNLLSQSAWFSNADALFGRFPFAFFLSVHGKSPARISPFGRDVSQTFRALSDDLELMKGPVPVCNETRPDDRLAVLVHRLTRAFVNHETKDRSGIDYESLKTKVDDQGRIRYPEAYRDAREKACSSAFLAMRGRRAEDFIEYFTGTICSVPQFLKEDEFVALSRALIDDPDTVKMLSMLALSAHSYLPSPKNTESPSQEGESP